MSHMIWKVRHKAGDNPDFFTISIKDKGYPLTVSESNFKEIFPNLNVDDIPEAPKTGKINIVGELV